MSVIVFSFRADGRRSAFRGKECLELPLQARIMLCIATTCAAGVLSLEDGFDAWRSCHQWCVLPGVRMGVSLSVDFRRRSGDAVTWVGNMIVLIMLLAELYPIEKSYMCLVKGEDNVTCFPVDIVLEDKSREAAEKYNMEIKTILMIRCISVPTSSFY